MCAECSAPLCAYPCFKNYHTKQQYQTTILQIYVHIHAQWLQATYIHAMHMLLRIKCTMIVHVCIPFTCY